MTLFCCRQLILSLTLAAIAATLGAACSDDDNASDDGKVHVLTSLPLFADFAREVGADRVEVTSLLPQGADPHTWEPDPKDVTKVVDADIIFVNGLDLEPAALNIIEPNIGDEVPLVRIAEEAGIDVREGDPHLWMDPANAVSYVDVIADHLTDIDPAGDAEYTANHDAYVADIEAANQYLETAVADIAEDNRKLITTHDAFAYLAEHIGFEITAFVSEGPGQDTSPGDIQAIVEAVEDQGVPAVFTEPQISGESDTLEQVAHDTVAAICTLYSDSLDDDVSTYIEMMLFNADELARCLGGSDGG